MTDQTTPGTEQDIYFEYVPLSDEDKALLPENTIDLLTVFISKDAEEGLVKFQFSAGTESLGDVRETLQAALDVIESAIEHENQ